MKYNGNNVNTNNSIMMNFCDNTKPNETKNDSQWNKACMCTGPYVNGSWVPCNSSSKLQAFSIHSILIIIWILRSLSSCNKLSYFRLQYTWLCRNNNALLSIEINSYYGPKYPQLTMHFFIFSWCIFNAFPSMHFSQKVSVPYCSIVWFSMVYKPQFIIVFIISEKKTIS